MPHLMCTACRLRFRRSLDVSLEAGIEDERCPSCDRPLEPVADPALLVGFQAGDDGAHARRPAAAGDDGAWGTLRVHAARLPAPEPPR